MSTITFSAVSPASVPALGVVIARASGLLLLYYVTYAIYNLYFAPLAKFPGPRLSAISRLPFVAAHVKGKLHDYFVDLHAQYGPIVRVAPDELTTIDPAAWKEIYQKRPALPKDPLALTPPPNGAETLFTAEGHIHSRMRRTFADAFSDKAVREQSACIESFVDLLLSRLRKDVVEAGNANVDIAKYYGYTSIDIMGELCLGESFHSLEGNNENTWIMGFFLGAVFGSIRASLSRYYPLDQIIAWLFMRMTSRIRQRNLKFGVDTISRRLEKGDLGNGRSDIISPVIGNIIEAKDQATVSKGITRDELNVNLLAMLMAGSQLTTTALASSTYYLLRRPEAMEKLKQEIHTAFTTEKDISIGSTAGLLYLEAVVTETLRMHHPTPSDPKSRVVASGGQEIAGYWVPGGATISIPALAASNSPSNWVEPETFYPERWLPPTHPLYDSRFEKDQKESFRPFSTGSRNCMGSKYVAATLSNPDLLDRTFLAESRLILARIVYAFELSLVNPEDQDWPDNRAWLAYEPKALMVTLKEKPR